MFTHIASVKLIKRNEVKRAKDLSSWIGKFNLKMNTWECKMVLI